MNPTFSVIVPVYNGERYLAKAITSILNQSLPVHEIIVVNDGSDDETEYVARQCLEGVSQAKIITQHNSGVAVARNTGISSATGNWIVFLDADDCWTPDKLSKCVNLLRQHPDIEFMHTNRIRVDQNGTITDAGHSTDNDYEDVEFLLSGWNIKTSTVSICKKLIERLDPPSFRSLKICEDFDFFWRAIAVATGIGYSKDANSIILERTGSLSRGENRTEHIVGDQLAIGLTVKWMNEHGMPRYAALLEDLRYRELQRGMLRSANWKEIAAIAVAAGSVSGWRTTLRAMASVIPERLCNRRAPSFCINL